MSSTVKGSQSVPSVHPVLDKALKSISSQSPITEIFQELVSMPNNEYYGLFHKKSKNFKETNDGVETDCQNVSFLYVSSTDRNQFWDPTREGAQFTSTTLASQDQKEVYKKYLKSLGRFINFAFINNLPRLVDVNKDTYRELLNSFVKTHFFFCTFNRYNTLDKFDMSFGLGKWQRETVKRENIRKLPDLSLRNLELPDEFLDETVKSRNNCDAFFKLAIACVRKEIIKRICDPSSDAEAQSSSAGCISISNIVSQNSTQPPVELSMTSSSQGLLNEMESAKTTTFSLELLSNIEELQVSSSSLEGKKLLEKAICIFLAKATSEIKAGYSDYKAFLEKIATKADEFTDLDDRQKINQLLKRHFELLDLQNSLKPQPQTRFNDKFKILVESKLLNGNSMNELELPLPSLPIKQNVINLYSMMDAINLLKMEFRDAGRWVVNQVKILEFKELCASIKDVCDNLRETILSWEDGYTLIGVNGKSQQWMIDIAKQYLPKEKMPREVMTTTHGSPFPYLLSGRNYMMFDDCGYSGEQLKDYLLFLLQTELKGRTPFSKPVNIYIIYGFLTDTLVQENGRWNSFLDALKGYNVHVHIIAGRQTLSSGTLMQKENLSDDMKNRLSKFVKPERPIVTTEWKTPDFMSLSMWLSEGYVDCDLLRTFHGENVSTCRGSVKLMNKGRAPIKEINPPYKK